MNEADLKKEALRGMKESDIAWQEFFKDKPEPKSDEEDKQQLEAFYHWYNYVRKQSDTGKTPAEMYTEAYGKEPPQNLPIGAHEPSRIMHLELDEEDDEDAEEEDEELIKAAELLFEKGVWHQTKEDLKEMSKREAARHMFSLGFMMHAEYMEKQFKELQEKFKGMTPEEIEKFLQGYVKDGVTEGKP